MALLASNDHIYMIKANWLRYFFEAFREVCAEAVTKSLRTIFITFLWVTRSNMMYISTTCEILEMHPEANREMLQILVYKGCSRGSNWIPQSENIIRHIHDAPYGEYKDLDTASCSGYSKEVKANEEPRFYNPFPIESSKSNIADLMWCKQCVANINEDRSWPWRKNGSAKRDKVKVEAWAWSDDE